MTTTERIIAELHELPETMQQEVLDFASFLKTRSHQVELDDLSKAQQISMLHVWDNPDDEVWNDAQSR